MSSILDIALCTQFSEDPRSFTLEGLLLLRQSQTGCILPRLMRVYSREVLTSVLNVLFFALLFCLDHTPSWSAQTSTYPTPPSSIGGYSSMYPVSSPATTESITQFTGYPTQSNHCATWSRPSSTAKPLDVPSPWSDNYR